MTVWTMLSLFYRQNSLRYRWIFSWIMVINYIIIIVCIILSNSAWASAGITYMRWMGKWKWKYEGGGQKLHFSICMQYTFVRVLKDCTCSCHYRQNTCCTSGNEHWFPEFSPSIVIETDRQENSKSSPCPSPCLRQSQPQICLFRIGNNENALTNAICLILLIQLIKSDLYTIPSF